MTEIPGYLLEDAVGAGAGGTVYRAVATRDHPNGPADGDRVAVKVMDLSLVRSRTGVERWRREARLAGKVRHPGVVRVHATGSDDESAWIVMNELTGPDLRTLLADARPLPAADALSLVAGVAEAMAAVHAAGLVHRDLKPANVVLHHGVPTVVDFGLARSTGDVDPSRSLTASQETSWAHTAGTETDGPGTAGTFAWMAPEQWKGEETTAATDVYALGGLLFSALTGAPPYPKETLTELAYCVALDDPPVPSRHGAEARFDGLVAIAMAKAPTDRFADAEKFLQALRRVEAGGSIAVPDARPDAAPPGRTPAGRGRLVAGVMAGAGVVLVVALGGVWLLGNDDESGGGGPGGPEPGTVLTVCAKEDASMRDEPGGEPLAQLPNGATMEVLVDDRNSDSWVLARAEDGTEGFVLTEYSKAEC